MRTKWTVIVAFTGIGAAAPFPNSAFLSLALAGDGPSIAAVVAQVTPAVSGDYEYVGSSKCKKCHIKQHKSWKKTRMGKAFEILKPGQSSEAKEKFKLDPAKDYTKDESCLACHTTGFGHNGGYAVPTDGDKKAAKKAAKLEGIGCESCHGPGSAYIKIFNDIQKSKRTYKIEELHAAGMTKIDAETCNSCHNEKGPTYEAAKALDFNKQKDEGTHEHQPLKQREG